jgi:Mg/Co/Ni transporter MgtE
LWNEFLAVAGWEKGVKPSNDFNEITKYGETWHYPNDASFVSPYASSHPLDDFAESFAEYFSDNRDESEAAKSRYSVLDKLFDGLKQKEVWDGHGETQEVRESGPVGKLIDWLAKVDPSKTITDFLTNLAAPRLADILPSLANQLSKGDLTKAFSKLDNNLAAGVLERLSTENMRTLLEGMSATRITRVLENVDAGTLKTSLNALSDGMVSTVLTRFNSNTFKSAMNGLTASRLGNVLRSVDGDTLRAALGRLSVSKAADVIERFDGGTLKAAMDEMGADWTSKVLERVDGATLKESLKRMSDRFAASVMTQFDGETLKEALKRLSDSRVANIINRFDSATLKEALKRMDVDRIKGIAGSLDKDAAAAAKDLVKKVTPPKISLPKW